jgi:subtilisin family serine protease
VQSWQLPCILSSRLNLITENSNRRKAVWGPKRFLSTLALAFALFTASQPAFAQSASKLDAALQARATAGSSLRTSRVIVTLAPGGVLPASLQRYDRKGKLSTINGHVLDVPDSVLTSLSSNGNVRHVHGDRPVHASNFRTAVASGALFARTDLGYTGAGVEVAVVDSGVAFNHDDLKNVSYFKDFTNVPRLTRYDDFGHGTHVSGILAGNGKDSGGQNAGIAPGASLVVLKVLDYAGNGTVANVIAALEWIAANYNQNGHNIRVVNLSIGAPVNESYDVDPLTIAAKRLVDLGITVVAAAGNGGNDSAGHPLWGAISSPANAPWVLTVGASSTEGTLTRADDKVARFSSRGPTLIDRAAKPDLVASGVGTVSTIATEASLYSINSKYLVSATSMLLRTKPYMVLSGTSMSAPVVSGTVALMLQANPNLTPNLIKAILQYTAEVYPGYDPLEEGAGFLNTLGAVRLAKFYATPHGAGDAVPIEPIWGRQIFWGNHRLASGFMLPTANAWNNGVQWGAAKTLGESGDNIVWGTVCGGGDCGDNIVWGTHADGDNIVWGTVGDGDNIVWGTAGDNIVWGTAGDGDNIVWGTVGDGDNIVWGTVCGGGDCGDNIVWGTHDGGDNIVWGTSDGDNIVWGTTDGDNIVWGTATAGDNIVWGTVSDGDNIVWGTVADGDNIVWGTVADGDNIVWGTLTRCQPRINLQNNPSYGWFLNQSNRAPWLRQEFGEVIANRPSGQ